jgi:hypothetical protein
VFGHPSQIGRDIFHVVAVSIVGMSPSEDLPAPTPPPHEVKVA